MSLPEQPVKVSYMSLPKKGQLAVLCLVRVIDPLASTSIQSYMFYQLRWFDPSASEATISTQAGFLVGARTAATVCTGMLWGHFADSDIGGRKAALIIGLLSSCIASVGYGLSTSFASAIFFQILAGALNNNVAVVRCVVAELNPEKRYRARALLLLPLCASAGMLIGPLVGGLLSFKTDGSFSRPFAPPNLLIGALYFVSATCVLLFLEETSETLQHRKDSFVHRLQTKIWSLFRGVKDTFVYAPLESETNPENSSSADPDSNVSVPLVGTRRVKKPKKLSFWRIWTPNVFCTMLAHFVVAGHLATFSNIWAIFLSTPVDKTSENSFPFHFNGGLGMSPRDVGFAMSLLGVFGVVLQMIVYPPLHDRYGSITIWRAALFVFPVVYILAPYPALVASTVTARHSSPVLIWLAMTFVLLLFVLGRTGITPATTLIINDCTPHPSVRGTIHATGTVVGNLGRSIFPVAALTVFGQGLTHGVVGLGFWCVAILAVGACVASHWVREGSDGGEIVLEDSDGEDEENQAAESASREDGDRVAAGVTGPSK